MSAIQSYRYALLNLGNAVYRGAIDGNVVTIADGLLACGQIYEFSIAAVSEFGVGPWSEAVTVQTTVEGKLCDERLRFDVVLASTCPK